MYICIGIVINVIMQFLLKKKKTRIINFILFFFLFFFKLIIKEIHSFDSLNAIYCMIGMIILHYAVVTIGSRIFSGSCSGPRGRKTRIYC